MFLKHTSAALALNENADPEARMDLKKIFNRLMREQEPYYMHVSEGPAFTYKVFIGRSELTLPLVQKILNLSIRQGIYFCEFQDPGKGRMIVATVIG